MRILGVDLGSKNTGLAISDDGEKIAVTYLTLRISDKRQLADSLRFYAQKEDVRKIVLGRSRLVSGELGAEALLQAEFGKLLEESGLTVEFEDETGTTEAAIAELSGQGKDTAHIDKEKDAYAAKIILQSYLDSR